MNLDPATMASLGKLGGAAALCFSALGSCLGVGAAGPAAVGSWKKCFLQGKAAPFVLITFIGAPLSQTIYGMILMNQMNAKCALAATPTPEQLAAVANWPSLVAIGVFGGMAMGASAWIQGRIGASASDSMAETGKGFGNYLMALGIVETVALFVMVFIGGLL